MKKCLVLVGLITTYALGLNSSFAETLPSAESLFAKHVKVSYGDNGLKEHRSMTLTTETLMKEFGVTVPAITKQKSPGYRFNEGEAMGIHTAAGCDLSFCWEQGMRGLEIVKGNELKRWLENADYHHWENMDKYSSRMETVEITQRDGEDVYKVKVIDKFDKENFYYFSKDRGFMVATELMIADMDSFNTRSTAYSDFKQFGPFTLAATSTETHPQVTRVITILDVSYADIPDSAFTIPESVKKLAAQE